MNGRNGAQNNRFVMNGTSLNPRWHAALSLLNMGDTDAYSLGNNFLQYGSKVAILCTGS